VTSAEETSATSAQEPIGSIKTHHRLGVQLGEPATRHRLVSPGTAIALHTTDKAAAAGGAVEILGLQLRQKAFTLAITDGFTLVTWAAVLCLVGVACTERVPAQYSQAVAAPALTA
jgi:MFS transporter, DHA2 family, multidrug resistance protein